jgi:hypothetical protein
MVDGVLTRILFLVCQSDGKIATSMERSSAGRLSASNRQNHNELNGKRRKRDQLADCSLISRGDVNRLAHKHFFTRSKIARSMCIIVLAIIMSWKARGKKLFISNPAQLSLRSLQCGFLGRKFLGTYGASPKHASIAFFDLHEVANTVFSPTNTYFI